MSRVNLVNRRSGTTRLARTFSALFRRNKPFIYFGINCVVIFSMLAAQFVSFAQTTAAAAPEPASSRVCRLHLERPIGFARMADDFVGEQRVEMRIGDDRHFALRRLQERRVGEFGRLGESVPGGELLTCEDQRIFRFQQRCRELVQRFVPGPRARVDPGRLAEIELDLGVEHFFVQAFQPAVVALDAVALSGAIKFRQTSCVEVMRAYLDQIDRMNPRVNAIVSLRPRAALLAR